MTLTLDELHDLDPLCADDIQDEIHTWDSVKPSVALNTVVSPLALAKYSDKNYLDCAYLSLEKEQELAQIYYNYQESAKNGEHDETMHRKALDAAHQLVMAHMRYVVKLSRQYINYGLPISDLIQEGAVGLMKAVQHFNPFKGVRLVSFAVYWIKSEIHNYIVRNWRMVKIATTKSQRKLFFNFRRLKASAEQKETTLQRNQRIAETLDVNLHEVEHMAQRFSEGEATIDAPVYNDRTLTLADMIPSFTATPEQKIIDDNYQGVMQASLKQALALLNARDKEIIQARFFANEPSTLKDLAVKFKISVERVRQLEKNALKMLKTSLNATEALSCS